jgi:hypothetical protein
MMKIFIKNPSADVLTYDSGALVIQPESTAELVQARWSSIGSCPFFRRDLKLKNIMILDDSEEMSESEVQEILLAISSEPKDSSGRKIVRQAITEPGNHFELVSIEVRTSNSATCMKDDGTDLGITSLVRRDVNGAVTTDPAATVITDVHLTFPIQIQAIGAILTQKEPATSDARFFMTAYPGVLNIPFGKGGVNLALIGIGGMIDADSKAPKDLPAIPGVPHFRIRTRHEAGLDHKFQLHMKIYTP